MIKNITAAFLVISAFTANCQVGEKFPKIETEMVSGKKVMLPGAHKGGYVLLGIGASRKAEADLKTWQNPIYNKFIAKTGMMDGMFDVEVCFIPVFTGTAKMAKDKVMKKLRENNELVVMNNVYVYSGELETIEAVGVEDPNEPYFILLDETGEIVWMEQGSFKQSYFDEIETILTE